MLTIIQKQIISILAWIFLGHGCGDLSHLGSSGIIWDHLRSCEITGSSIWDHLGSSSGIIWDHLWETSGGHLGSGNHLGGLWDGSGSASVGGIWGASGIWEASEKHLDVICADLNSSGIVWADLRLRTHLGGIWISWGAFGASRIWGTSGKNNSKSRRFFLLEE